MATSVEQNDWVARVLRVNFEQAGAELATAPPGVVQFAKLRLAWLAAKQAADKDLAQLRATVTQEQPGDPLLANLARLDEVLAPFNEGLADRLDDLANAAAPEARRAAAGTAKDIAQTYFDKLLDYPLLDYIEMNPFEDVAVSGRLMEPLSAIIRALDLYAAAAAKENVDA